MPDGILSSIAQLPGLARGARCDQVGVDLIEIERIRRALERYPASASAASPRPSARTATRARTRRRRYAGRFAGKEAVGKALGLGVARAFAWRDIEIVGRPKPSVTLRGRRARVGGAASAPARSTSR